MKIEINVFTEDKTNGNTKNSQWIEIENLEDGVKKIKESNFITNGQLRVNNENNRVEIRGKDNVWFINKYGKTIPKQEGIFIESNDDFFLYIMYSQIEDALIKSIDIGIIDGYTIDIMNNDNIDFTYYKVFDEGQLKNIEESVSISNAKKEEIYISDIVNEISKRIIN